MRVAEKRQLREVRGAAQLKIVISGHEICGLIHDLAEELRNRGHAVTTIARRHRFFPHSYDYDQYDFPVSLLGKRFGGKPAWRFAFKALWEVKSDWHKSLETRLRLQVLDGADLYIRVWGIIPYDREVLSALDTRTTKVATLLMGSDVRDYDVFAQQYKRQRVHLPVEYEALSLAEKLAALRTHERYADAVFSLPDQMGLALRPYHHLQVPLDLKKFRFNVPARDVPKVVHAPSEPKLKGTDKIEEALARLKSEGCEFELVSLRDISHTEVLSALSDADVLVDELVLHGPGWLSFEAMASGCAVATRYLTDSPECFRPPVVPIDETNIVDQLRLLLRDRNLRVRLAEEGRRYVEAHNTVEQVVDSVLQKVEEGKSGRTDYTPTFLRDDFKPENEAQAHVINEWNALVYGESWYIAGVKGRAHDGLVF